METMRNLTTNLALLMDWARVTPKELNRALGIDLSLISRWRTGSRRLSAQSRWCGRLTEYFLRAHRDEVTALMARVSPLGASRGQPPEEFLACWLGETAGPWENRDERLFLTNRESRRLPDAGPLSGGRAVRRLLMEFLNDVLAQPDAGEIVFLCSQGLELFTREEPYARALQEKLQVLFQRKKRIRAVLRTDYRPSDVALVCGPWLRAHLMGHVQSLYYDDFRPLEQGKILFGLRGRLMVQVRVKDGVPQADLLRRPERIAEAEAYFDDCARRARPRFVYRFFSCPADLLRGVPSGGESPAYLLARLPDLGGSFETLSRYLRLRPEEDALFRSQFRPLALPPWEGDRPAQTRHIFCEDNIDQALDGKRHLCRPFSEICGRRLYLSAGGLAEQLSEMRRALERKPEYQVCFMPQEWFDRLGMELVVWGTDAAVAWIAGRQSAACRDYPSTTALHGFCAAMWDRIPPTRRSRQAALKRLERWLERVRRFGLIPEAAL